MKKNEVRVMGKNLQQTNKIEALLRHAQLARSDLERYANALCEELGYNGHTHVKMGEIKALDRIFEKASKPGNEGRVENLNDICRARLLIESPEDIETLRSMMIPGRNNHDFNKTWDGRGVKLVEFEDYFAAPSSTGFRAINMTLEIDLGKGRSHYVELQVAHWFMQDTLDRTHELKKKIREIEETAAAEDRELYEDEREVVRSYKDQARELHEQDADRLDLRRLETATSGPQEGTGPVRRFAP